MPELPEVETICRGLRAALSKEDVISSARIIRRDLRVPIQKDLPQWLAGQSFINIRRRAKYLLFDTVDRTIISHLGMSGTWRFVDDDHRKHDHFYITFEDGRCLAFHDPRRFGLITCVKRGEESRSKWLKSLGPEPLSEAFSAEYLNMQAQNKTQPIKNFLMDQKIVVGIGNIYASEILFQAKIKPMRIVKRVQLSEWHEVVKASLQVLNHAINSKGTTLRDYTQSSGDSGEFQNELYVYGRNEQRCRVCEDKIKIKAMAGRSTYWCAKCQK